MTLRREEDHHHNLEGGGRTGPAEYFGEGQHWHLFATGHTTKNADGKDHVHTLPNGKETTKQIVPIQ